MKQELKKLIVFGVIITSAYTAFLNTLMKQGLPGGHFISDWLSLIPKTYVLLLPFVLVTGRLTSILVERIFRNTKKQENELE
jgi:L-cystine uptake protein TcyP (sodium:dicarboxylate symporter family)